MGIQMLKKFIIPYELKEILEGGAEIIFPTNREHIVKLSMGGDSDKLENEVSFNTFSKDSIDNITGNVIEARVVKCKNGIVVNYDDKYMRRRDPDSMVVADDLPTDKPKFKDKFGEDFSSLRSSTFNWLKKQEQLIVVPFLSGAGAGKNGYQSMLIIPAEAAFFALALMDIQGFIPEKDIPDSFKPKAIVYVAPPFRHSHFGGKQVVVHNRVEIHEIFSYNLYPGPSAKKGIYSALLNIGEKEGWVTLHASTVKITTPYELTLVIMHEGASGSGKSEMTEEFHRDTDGRLLLGKNIVTGEEHKISITDTSELSPITDDMAMCLPSMQNNSNKLVIVDAEAAWFLRVNHIVEYGTQPDIEKKSINPPEPLLFLNMEAVPGSTCLIWEHIMDEPGKPCSNPRLVFPRKFIDNVSDQCTPVEVDVRSFGIRQPPSTRENPNYGIAGLFHVLPPALAWLWRLVSPRGFENPSIIDSGKGMISEGVGSYWPFATGLEVDQANLLLDQIIETLSTRYILIPNQHIGAYKVGFAGQWAAREYISRRGGVKFKPGQLQESRCPLLGYSLDSIKIDGISMPKGFFHVDRQPEVGIDGYDAGAKILRSFFESELPRFLVPEMSPLGKKIINACLDNCSVEEYFKLIPKL